MTTDFHNSFHPPVSEYSVEFSRCRLFSSGNRQVDEEAGWHSRTLSWITWPAGCFRGVTKGAGTAAGLTARKEAADSLWLCPSIKDQGQPASSDSSAKATSGRWPQPQKKGSMGAYVQCCCGAAPAAASLVHDWVLCGCWRLKMMFPLQIHPPVGWSWEDSEMPARWFQITNTTVFPMC